MPDSFDRYIDLVNKPNRRGGDYEKEGLLYCGKCHAPKQKRGEDISISLAGKLLSTPCKCAEQREAEEKKAAELEAIETLRKKCLPLEALRRCRFETADHAKHIRIAQKYAAAWERVKRENISLALWGNTGTGKSFAALCIANAIIDKGERVIYISSVDAVDALMTKDAEKKKDFIAEICKAPLLVVDDVGAESESSYAQTQLCRLIEARRESGKPFIITTNYTKQEIDTSTERTTARLFDRLRGSCVFVLVDGESRRKTEGEQRTQLLREILGA